MKTLMVIAALLLMLTDIRADETPVFGAGLTSCGKFVKEQKNPSEPLEISATVDMHWVLGYVSGFAYSRTVALKDVEHEGIKQWMINYCTEHPLQILGEAAGKLVLHLYIREQRRN